MSLRIGIIFVLLAAATDGAAEQTAAEFEVEAAFLYNLAKFVKWPAESFHNAKDPIVVCILGNNQITEAAVSAVNGKVVDGRSFVIRPVSDAQPANNCHMLFVGVSARKRLRDVLPENKANGVLAVGEADTFIAEGGIINFKLDGDRIRIQLNLDAAEQRHLQVSSKLSGLAQIVTK